MKPIAEQDHYEILEISPDAAVEVIERAYRMAQVTYADDSLAGYSVFGAGDSEAIRERVEIAYRVLMDAEARRAYDVALAGGEVAEPPVAEPIARPNAGDSGEALAPPEHPERLAAAAEPTPPLPIDELDALEDEGREFDGARLRRARLHRGMELEDVSGVTKISATYLRYIEEDRFAELPAPVYIRGFVAAFADCMGLDSKRIAASYMKHFKSETGDSRGGSFLGGV